MTLLAVDSDRPVAAGVRHALQIEPQTMDGAAPHMTAGREIKVIETALRDGQQCLWATRMTTAMMLPIAEKLDRAGYDTIDMMGSIQFDVCVRYLKENPWERLPRDAAQGRAAQQEPGDLPGAAGRRGASLGPSADP
jgi:pyruvate carboxylase